MGRNRVSGSNPDPEQQRRGRLAQQKRQEYAKEKEAVSSTTDNKSLSMQSSDQDPHETADQGSNMNSDPLHTLNNFESLSQEGREVSPTSFSLETNSPLSLYPLSEPGFQSLPSQRPKSMRRAFGDYTFTFGEFPRLRSASSLASEQPSFLSGAKMLSSKNSGSRDVL